MVSPPFWLLFWPECVLYVDAILILFATLLSAPSFFVVAAGIVAWIVVDAGTLVVTAVVHVALATFVALVVAGTVAVIAVAVVVTTTLVITTTLVVAVALVVTTTLVVAVALIVASTVVVAA